MTVLSQIKHAIEDAIKDFFLRPVPDASIYPYFHIKYFIKLDFELSKPCETGWFSCYTALSCCVMIPNP